MIPIVIAGAPLPTDQDYDADIVILALDRIDDTLAAIRSAIAQTGIARHVLVLDQGSASAGLARLVAAVDGQRCATLLSVGRNLGVAAGRNAVSNLGAGRVIIALDNDAVFADTGTAARLVAALDAEPRLGAIGCRIVRDADGADDWSSWGYPASLRSCAGESFDTVTFVGAGHAIRRAAWDEAGGYDPKLFFCWEEFDFCLRAIPLGWQVRYRGDIVIRHKAAAERRVEARWFYFVRNRLYIERKRGRSWRQLLPRCAGYLLRGALNGQLAPTLRAISASTTMAPRLARHRMTLSAADYFRRNDQAHRGSMLHRLVLEVMPSGLLNRWVSSKPITRGLSSR